MMKNEEKLAQSIRNERSIHVRNAVFSKDMSNKQGIQRVWGRDIKRRRKTVTEQNEIGPEEQFPFSRSFMTERIAMRKHFLCESDPGDGSSLDPGSGLTTWAAVTRDHPLLIHFGVKHQSLAKEGQPGFHLASQRLRLPTISKRAPAR